MLSSNLIRHFQGRAIKICKMNVNVYYCRQPAHLKLIMHQITRSELQTQTCKFAHKPENLHYQSNLAPGYLPSEG